MLPVTIANLSKSYTRGTRVLDDVSLTIAAGELFFLLGPSGCGKTTLLRLLAGFTAPDSGSIHFGERAVTHLPPNERQATLVFQNYALWPHLTVYENVVFGLDVQRVPAAEARQRVHDTLAVVGLAELADRRVPALSGGQQQRVALARALAVRPPLLLLDEPLSNLDAKLRLHMRSEIRRICKASGVTALYVTHDQKEALSMADRLAVMDHGRLVQVGAPRDVYRHPANAFVADFIGEANFVPAELLGADGATLRVRTPLADLAVTRAPGQATPAAGSRGQLVLRPESLRALAPDAAVATPNAFPVTLVEQAYLGESAQYQVSAGGLTLKLVEQAPPPRIPGDVWRCTVAPDDLVFLVGGE